MKKIFFKQGEKFGKLTVIGFAENYSSKGSHWKCLCDCGEETCVLATFLKSGHTSSCGCRRKEVLKKISSTHGLTNHPLYYTWQNFNDRCYNVDSCNFFNYGARKITVCYDWKRDIYGGPAKPQGLLNFIKWGEEQARKQNISLQDLFNKRNGKTRFYSLDRINNNKDYSPENCKWATKREQSKNQRKPIKNSFLNKILKIKNNKIKSLQEKIRRLERKIKILNAR